MKILAFESAAVSASVLCWEDGNIIASAYQRSGLTHSSTLLPMTDAMLKNAGLTIDDMDVLAVSAGPGSFTGLRIGISMVKGLAFEKNIPCIGVSTPEAIAYCLPKTDAVACIVMDARAGQVYNALFDISGEKPVRLCEDRAIKTSELREELEKIDKKLVIAGDGAELIKDMGEVMPENLRWENAYGVARLAAEKYAEGGDFSPNMLRPDYHRLPQAERERLEKLKNIVEDKK